MLRQLQKIHKARAEMSKNQAALEASSLAIDPRAGRGAGAGTTGRVAFAGDAVNTRRSDSIPR